MRIVVRGLIVLGIAILMVSCGKVEEIHQTIQEAPEVIKVEDVTSDVKRPVFHGYFNLSGADANCIYLDEKQSGIVDVEADCFSLVSKNPKDNSLGQFPALTSVNLVVVNDEIRFTRNLNFTSGNDIETDASGSNVTGSRRSDVVIKFKDGKLNITIQVYDSSNNNNLDEVIVEREFNEI